MCSGILVNATVVPIFEKIGQYLISQSCVSNIGRSCMTDSLELKNVEWKAPDLSSSGAYGQMNW